MDVTLWERSAQSLAAEDYRALYEADRAGFYLEALRSTTAFYQQLHVAVATAVVFVGSCAKPPVPPKIDSLQKLGQSLADHPDADMRARFGGIQREVRYLKWLCTVRNKAVQHRAGNDHHGSDALILPDGLAFIRRRHPIDELLVATARSALERVNRSYGLAFDTVGTSEVFAYLDFVSQRLYAAEDDEFDRLRQLIQRARLHQVIMSPHLIETTDRALATLIGMLPAEPSERSA